jgi:hypothetical protein
VAPRRTARPTSPHLTQFAPSSPWVNLEAFIAKGGNISLGRVAPIECAAVASDEHDMLAALVRRKDESFMDLMQRLDAAIAKALETGEFTDEINVRPPSRR